MNKVLQQWAAASVVMAAGLGTAGAQTTGTLSGDVLRIGVLTDISGVYADISGKGAVEAVKMAVEDFGGRMFGKPIDVVFADHQNKADVGAAKAREWFDAGGVDLINDLANSGVALAVAGVAKEKKRHIIVNNASNVGITNAQCSPYAVHYAYDAYSLAHGTGRAVVEGGGDTWFFLTVDFAFGIGLEQQVSDVVRAAKGRVVGPRSSAWLPLATTPSMPSRRRRSSASRRTRSLPPCCCGSRTCTPWACRRHRGCSSPTPGTGT
jgi:branched-chain amino acid transport system substrate-binding protein